MNYKDKIAQLKQELAATRQELRKQQEAAAQVAAKLCEALRKEAKP